ncbi:MAG: lysophospholipase [Bacteroidales bacterium]|nr:lysophospholipase [Bacteroidales bacterium]
MNNLQFQWQSFDGHSLFGQSWIPEENPKAVINFVHGIGEHSSRYQNWMPFFVENGFAVFAIEYRGHGHSFGKRGYIEYYEDILKDIDVLFEESKKAYPDLPQFLYGHSLGGNIVINYTLRRKPEIIGLIATSPWLWLTKEPPKWQVNLVKSIKSFLGGLTIPTNIKANQITQNSEIVEHYKKDPLVHNKISLTLFASAYENGKWAVENAKAMPVPFYLLHGANDPITSPKGSEAFYKNNPEKTQLKIWEGMLHELHNEPIREQHAEHIINWMNQQLNL